MLSTAGKYKGAGLPNITGAFDTKSVSSTGAFWKQDTTTEGQAWWNGTNNMPWKSVHFSAQKSHAIYGNSNTVQPSAVQIQYLIKY